MTKRIEKVLGTKKIVTHFGCHDGTASALLASYTLRQFKIEHEVLFFPPGSKGLRELPAEPGLLFLDLSPPEERLQEFLDVETVVFDHHPTAESVVKKFEAKRLGAYENGPDVCGATLTFKYIFDAFARLDMTPYLYDLAKKVSKLAAIQDNYQTRDPWWLDAVAQAEALTFYGWAHWEDHVPYLKPEELYIGAVLRDRNISRVEWIAKNAMLTSWAGFTVAIFPANGRFTSQVFDLMAKDGVHIGMGFSFIKEEGKIRLCFSVRSVDEFNSGEFAKRIGGGGHINAAGFNTPCQHDASPYEIARSLLHLHGEGS